MRRADPDIEFVGLPGAGKSTITRALPPGWPTSRNTDPPPLPLSRRLWLYRQALAIFHEQAPWIPQAHPKQFSAISRDVEGFTLSPMGSNNYAKVKRH